MADTSWKPDFSLMRPITPKDAPFFTSGHLKHFERDDKHLYFVGTSHSTDWSTKSHEIIDQAAAKHKPQLIILEGIESDRGLSPDLGFDPKNPEHRRRFHGQAEENIHTAEAARHAKIPFMGGEPSSAKIFSDLQEKNYGSKDVQAMLLLRMVPIWKRSRRMPPPEEFPKFAEAYLKSDEFKHIPAENRLSYDEFVKIYDAHKAGLGNKPFFDVTSDDVNSSNNPNYFQRMNAERMKLRDKNLLEVIGNAMGSYDRVMVVYGDAHRFTTEPVLEGMFGKKAVVEKLVLASESEIAKDSPAIKSASQPSKPLSTGIKIGAGLLAATAAGAVFFGAPVVAGIAALGCAVSWLSSKKATLYAPQSSATHATALPVILNATGSGQVPQLQQAAGKSWVQSTRAAEISHGHSL